MITGKNRLWSIIVPLTILAISWIGVKGMNTNKQSTFQVLGDERILKDIIINIENINSDVHADILADNYACDTNIEKCYETKSDYKSTTQTLLYKGKQYSIKNDDQRFIRIYVAYKDQVLSQLFENILIHDPTRHNKIYVNNIGSQIAVHYSAFPRTDYFLSELNKQGNILTSVDDFLKAEKVYLAIIKENYLKKFFGFYPLETSGTKTTNKFVDPYDPTFVKLYNKGVSKSSDPIFLKKETVAYSKKYGVPTEVLDQIRQ